MSHLLLSIVPLLYGFIICGAIDMMSDNIQFSKESIEHCITIVVSDSYSSGKAIENKQNPSVIKIEALGASPSLPNPLTEDLN